MLSQGWASRYFIDMRVFLHNKQIAMNTYASRVERHYARQGIFEGIIQKLEEMGIGQVTRKDLASIDEFHVRGAAVSRELAAAADLKEETAVLDVGCGI